MRAMVDPGVGVIAQGFAVGAQGVAARAVVAMAVQLDHQAHDLFFPCSRFWAGVVVGISSFSRFPQNRCGLRCAWWTRGG